MYCLLAASGIFFSACKKKDKDADGSNAYVNYWIYSKMNYWYYWNTSMPQNLDKSLAPETYFSRLLKTPDDHFSWIQNNYLDLLNSLSGVSKEAGYDFSLFLYGGDKLGGQILYVKKGSPAEAAGLKRGDYFFKVNGATFSYTSQAVANAMVDLLYKNHTLSIGTYNSTTKTFDLVKDMPLTVVEFAENPVYLDTVYTVGGKKTGYFVYNFFAPGPSDNSTTYDDAVDAVFARFKAAGVNNLVLDLRYNPGGNEISTINLGSLIVKGAGASDVFFRREYNSTVTAQIIADGDEEFLQRKFIAKASNIGAGLEKFVIITSDRTASASELIINGLRPYMTVTLIGDTTYGKNVGSTTLYAENDPKNKYGLQPIITKTFNKNNQSDYSNGFAPDVKLVEDVDLKPLGDITEPLLSAALNKVTNGRVGQFREVAPRFPAVPVVNSIDKKGFAFKLIQPQASLPAILKK